MCIRDSLLSQPQELSKELSKITPDDKTYKKVKEILMSLDKTQEMLADWKTDSYKREDVISLSDLERASLYYFNHNTSYGPGYLGWGSSVYLQADKWKQMCNNINNFLCPNLSVQQADYRDVIPNYKKDLFNLILASLILSIISVITPLKSHTESEPHISANNDDCSIIYRHTIPKKVAKIKIKTGIFK